MFESRRADFDELSRAASRGNFSKSLRNASPDATMSSRQFLPCQGAQLAVHLQAITYARNDIRMANNRKLSKAEADLCFGPALALLPELPHCIMQANRSVLGTILSTLMCDGAIWGGGTYPLFDARDERFEPAQPYEHFELWSLPRNQDWLRRRGAFAVPNEFMMVVDAATPFETIKQIYDARCGEAANPFSHEICLALLVTQWIHDLGWAYVPLGDKTNYAMFIASPKREELPLMAEMALTRNGEPLFDAV